MTSALGVTHREASATTKQEKEEPTARHEIKGHRQQMRGWDRTTPVGVGVVNKWRQSEKVGCGGGQQWVLFFFNLKLSSL